REHGKDNPRMLQYEDLAKPCRALGGKTLTNVYTYFSSLQSVELMGEDSDRNVIEYMCDTLGVPHLNTEQWISIVRRQNSKVSWAAITKHTKSEILSRAAYELGFKSPRFMNYHDICNTKFRFINGKTLSGLYY